MTSLGRLWWLGSRPYAWLRPDFVPPSPFPVLPFLLCKTKSPSLLRSWWSLISLMLGSGRLGCLSLASRVIRWSRLSFVDFILPQEPILDLPRITGQDLLEVAPAKKSTAGGLDGWAWNEILFLPLAWFSGLAILLNMVETSAVWPQGLLDAYMTMIPEVDGTPLLWVSAPPPIVSCQLFVDCGPRSGLLVSRIGYRTGSHSLSSVLGMGCRQLRRGFPLHWTLRRSFLALEGITCTVADVIKSFDTVDRSMLDCALGRLGLPSWFGKVHFAYHDRVKHRFQLAAGFGRALVPRWVYSAGLPPEHGFDCCLVCALVLGVWKPCLLLSPSFVPIILCVVLCVPMPCLVLLDSSLNVPSLWVKMCLQGSVSSSSLPWRSGRV